MVKDLTERRLARVLPADLTVRSVTVAPPGFDARFSAIWRRYVYRLAETTGDPLHRGLVHRVGRPLDVEAMDAAAGVLAESIDLLQQGQQKKLQADIAAELVRRGVEVWISNHRSVDGILDYVRRLGALVGAGARATAHADGLQRGLDAIAAEAAALPRRPKVYFEEWDEPPITGIRWVAELIRIAGGDDIFPEHALEPLAKARILEDPGEVIRRVPDIILGSWCGKKFRPDKVATRPGWDAIPAVRDGQMFEIKSPIILQPGPAALTDGVAEIARIIREWSKEEGAE